MNVSTTPKYQIGDKVFYVSTTTTAGMHECPDCLGTRKWACKSPAGLELEMDCPRCTRNGGWNDNLSLAYTKHVPYVRQLTIGSVRTDTADKERPVSYMCVETGVGSGSIYDETSLFDNEESANSLAAIRCAELQFEENKRPEAMTSAAHSRLGYFESLRSSAFAEADRNVRASFKNDVEDSVPSERTPGIWHVRDGYTDDNGVFRFSIGSTDPVTKSSLSICDGYGGLSQYFASREQGPANARLIAAAPDLLEALLRCKFDSLNMSLGDLDFCRAAYSKATGEPGTSDVAESCTEQA